MEVMVAHAHHDPYRVISMVNPCQIAHAHLDCVVVPSVRLDLSSRRVLTLEWIDGERTSDLLMAAGIKGGTVCGSA